MKNPAKAQLDQDAVSDYESADPIIDLAKVILFQNRKRQRFMPQLDWGEPSWFMLLDLFIAETEDLDSSATAIAERNKIPLSTARRYLALMVERGLLERADPESSRDDPDLRLTQTAKHGLVSWIRNVMSSMASYR